MRDNKIINVRGTSGSGKTTLIRGVLTQYPFVNPMRIEGRKQPLYYIYSGAVDLEGAALPSLALLGHYESACGGCDTISKYLPGLAVHNAEENKTAQATQIEGEGNSYDTIFGLVRALYAVGYDVLYEGLLISGDMARTKALHADALPVSVVCLQLPIQECLDSVIGRRAAKGNTKEFNPKNTIEKHKLLAKCIEEFPKVGVHCYSFSIRDYALDGVCHLLGISIPTETQLNQVASFVEVTL